MAEGNLALKVVLVAVLLAVVMIAFTFAPKPVLNTPLTGGEAEQLARNDASLIFPTAELSALSTTPLPNHRWKVRLKISLNTHAACPQVYIREYELLPILHREEQVVKGCIVSAGPLVYPEEALLKSLSAPAAKSAADVGGYGCAVRANNLAGLTGQCIAAQPSLRNTVNQLPADAWVASWIPPANGTIVNVGLDKEGRILLVESTPVGN